MRFRLAGVKYKNIFAGTSAMVDDLTQRMATALGRRELAFEDGILQIVAEIAHGFGNDRAVAFPHRCRSRPVRHCASDRLI